MHLRSLFVVAAVLTFSNASVDAALVAHYAFSGNFEDSSPNAYHATASGSPSFVPGPSGFGNGLHFDNGLYTDQTNYGDPVQYLDCGTGPADHVYGNLTVAFWMKVDGHASEERDVILDTLGYGGNWGFHIDDQLDKLSGEVSLSGTVRPLLVGTTIAMDGTWHHYAVVIETTSLLSIKSYVDGRLTSGAGGSGAFTGHPDSPVSLWIGGQPDSDYFFTGALDEVRIYDEALSESDIAALTVPEPASILTLALAALLSRRLRSPRRRK